MHCIATNHRISTDEEFRILGALYRKIDTKVSAHVDSLKQINQVATGSELIENISYNTVKIKGVKDSSKLELSIGNGSAIEHHDFDVILDILKEFGHLISKLTLDYDSVDEHHRSLLNQQINKFCAKSLTDIELIQCNENDFSEFQEPFEKVESVQMNFGHLMNATSRFDRLFPSVRRLDLGGMHFVHPDFVEHHFEHLELLAMESLEKGNLRSVERRLQLNPQLKHVSLFRCNWNLLKIISETMPDLESLELNGFNDFSNYAGNDIHFEQLKIFRFQKFSGVSKTIQKIPLVFGNLEEISCSKPMDKWLEIIIQNKHLKEVTTGVINNRQLFQIVEELPELEDFTTGYSAYDSTGNVVRFMNKGKHLRKVSFWQSNFNSPNEIVEQLGNKWRFQVEGGRFVFIKN